MSNFPTTLQEGQKLMNNHVGTNSSVTRARAQPPLVDEKITANDGLTFLNKDGSPNTQRGKCNKCGSGEHWEVPKFPEYKKDKDLSEKYCNLESETTKKLKAGAPVLELTALVVATTVPPETRNLHATLGIEDDDFSGEDNYGLALLNIAADSDPKVATKIDSIKYDTVFKKYGGKVNLTWILLDNQ